ncbi:MAG TPA: ATP-binding protein [Thermoleophilia bacterium]|jgi:anti-sigma regulatory factor (Ser/Thr protein kinase)|nr:ATP-binding protein [Acidobacteriota bacterium]HQF51499.1 ATP-binding protein [Thermoleophilia bacterium]
MADDKTSAPASLRVYRYRAGAETVEAVLGTLDPEVPQEDLVAHADEALERDTFMCYAVSQADDFVADELCFVPQGDHCDILSIHTDGWQRHHGDHRRSLVEILNDLAAAVACGKLRVLDAGEVERAAADGLTLLERDIRCTADLQAAREAVDDILRETGADDVTRRRTVLCISEAITNMLLHGGGHGAMTVRRLGDRLRFVVADRGPGLNFLNWIEPPAEGGQASMGYGYKIILDHLDSVALHTGSGGTTLVLDRLTS